MKQYITSYLVYLAALLTAYGYGRATNVMTKFPLKALIFLPIPCPLVSAALGFEVMAAYMDKEYDMNVYDVYHICAILNIAIEFLYNILKGKYTLSMFSLYDFIPLLFVLVTMFARGMSDTFAMCIYAIAGICHHIDMIYVIAGFLAGHIIQIIIKFIYCKKNKIKYKKVPPMPFLPALYAGCSIALFIGINMAYINSAGGIR